VQAIHVNSAASEYMRVSCAYCVSHGFRAASTAAIHAVRVPISTLPLHHATGTHTSANSSENTCVVCSPASISDIQTCSSM
jgi:hypothetical protein